MTEPINLAELSERPLEGVVLTDVADGRYNDYVLITAAERDALIDAVEAAAERESLLDELGRPPASWTRVTPARMDAARKRLLAALARFSVSGGEQTP